MLCIHLYAMLYLLGIAKNGSETILHRGAYRMCKHLERKATKLIENENSENKAKATVEYSLKKKQVAGIKEQHST